MTGPLTDALPGTADLEGKGLFEYDTEFRNGPQWLIPQSFSIFPQRDILLLLVKDRSRFC